MKAANTDTAKAACVQGAGKAALETSLGRPATATEAQAFAFTGAVSSVNAAMATCMATAGTTTSAADIAARSACRDSTAAGALATSLGRSSVTATEVHQFADDAAKQNIATQMGVCMKLAEALSTEAQKTAARTACTTNTVKAAMAESLGTTAADISDTAQALYMAQAGAKSMNTAITTCVTAATTAAAKAACADTEGKAAMAASLGRVIGVRPRVQGGHGGISGQDCVFVLRSRFSITLWRYPPFPPSLNTNPSQGCFGHQT